MLFSRETNADQFDLFSYGNVRRLEANSQHPSCTEINLRDTISNSCVTDLGKENRYGKSEESSLGNSKDGPSSSLENISFSWLLGGNCPSATRDHKRPLFNSKPCQIACKRPKQTDDNTGLYSFEERSFNSPVEISASALADDFVETRQLDHISANNGTAICSGGSDIPPIDGEQSAGLESIQLPEWVTSFPGYFDDCGLIAGHNLFNDTASPVHEYLSRKDVPIGRDHQADIPEWRPRASVNLPGTSYSCVDMAYTSESVPIDDDSESDKWVRNCVIPMPFSTSPVDCVGDTKIDCDCSDGGSYKCAIQHIIEARETLKMSLGQDKFRDIGLCEMGEDVAQGWTDEEEKRFLGVVFSNPVSLGKNFWDYLPHAFPGKTSKELVSYYFNVFMLRKRAQQNRSDLLHVDSDDDEFPDLPPATEQEEEGSEVDSPIHEHFVDNSLCIEDAHEESEGEHTNGSLFHEMALDNSGECRYPPNHMPMNSNVENLAENGYN